MPEHFECVSRCRLIDPFCVDILDRCKPDAGTVDPEFGLSTAAICHQSDRHILNDGFRSFPSGHSSCMLYLQTRKEDKLTLSPVSFAGLTFLSLYLAGKMHLFDTRGHAVCAKY
jgi:diacylglycerol diphosphate phosphatase/phosphatidate phosphatase